MVSLLLRKSQGLSAAAASPLAQIKLSTRDFAARRLPVRHREPLIAVCNNPNAAGTNTVQPD
jgi:hypothetical protein